MRLTIDDFVAYMPMHAYIFTPCREIWPGVSVNAHLPRMPLLDRHGQRPAAISRTVVVELFLPLSENYRILSRIMLV